MKSSEENSGKDPEDNSRKPSKLIIGSKIEDLFQTSSNNMSSNKDTSSDQLTSKAIDESSLSPLDKIYLNPIALLKMFWMAEAVYSVFHEPFEVYALCLGKKGKIYDILIPHQIVSYASVYIDHSAIHELRPHILSLPYEVLGWTHSHANFGVFFSNTDDTNQATLLHDTANYTEIEGIRVKYSYGMTVNMHWQAYGVVSTQFPSGNIINTRAQLRVDGRYPKHWNYSEVYQSLRSEIREKISFEKKSRSRKSYLSNPSLPQYNLPSQNDSPHSYLNFSPTDSLFIDKFIKNHVSHEYTDPSIRDLLAEFLIYTRQFSHKHHHSNRVE